MRTLRAIVGSLVLLVTLAPVRTPAAPGRRTRTPLEDAIRAAITHTKIVTSLDQKGLHVAYSAKGTGNRIDLVGTLPRSTMGNPLADALTDATNASRANEARRLALPLQTIMEGWDAAPLAEAAVARELQGIEPFRGGTFVLRREGELGPVLDGLIAQEEVDAVLSVYFTWHLSPSRNEVVVWAIGALFPAKRSPSLAIQEVLKLTPITSGIPMLYRGELFASVAVPPGEGTAVERWAADDGAPVRRAVAGGIAEVARLLVFDLQQGGPSGLFGNYKVKGAAHHDCEQFGGGSWYELRKENGRTWARERSGKLGSFGGSHPDAPAPDATSGDESAPAGG